DRSLTAEQLSVLLYYAWGCHGYLPMSEGQAALKKTSPSGGALHPVEVYPLVLSVEGIESGLYHYCVGEHALEPMERLSRGDAKALAHAFTAGQFYFAESQALFVMTARFARSYWKYQRHAKAYAVVLMDAAHLSQTFYLLCADLGLGAFVTAAINNADIDERLG